jgi:hypothetical protein
MVVMAKSFNTSQRMSRLILVGNIPPSVATTHCPIRHQSEQAAELINASLSMLANGTHGGRV